MTETGMRPRVSPLRRKVLDGMRLLFTPLLPDDYLELIDPMWSTRELRGRIERLQPQADGAVTVHIRPSFDWVGHRAGQYVRLGVVVDGRHHWRAYSLTSPPGAPDGLISITPKRVDGGVVSPYLTGELRVGQIVRLGDVEGRFTLPDTGPGDTPEPLLLLTAGSGVTPVISMLRHLEATGALAERAGAADVVHVHCARTPDDVIFGDELRALAAARRGLTLHLWSTAERGHLTPAELERLCPDWRRRQTYACGPAGLLDTLDEHWTAERLGERLHTERFQPVIGTGGDTGAGGAGAGGTVRFPRRNLEAECPPGTSLLVAGERAGVQMPFGCRMGVCHTCVVRARSGTIRDLRGDEVRQVHDEMVRTCIHGAESLVELDL